MDIVYFVQNGHHSHIFIKTKCFNDKPKLALAYFKIIKVIKWARQDLQVL